jgi:hypothetical protein
MLNKALDQLTGELPDSKTSDKVRMLVQYLLVLGDDRLHLKA